MTVSACSSLASSRRFWRSSSAIRLSRASCGFPFRPRLAGRNPANSPASRCRRHVLKVDENNPSRRSNPPLARLRASLGLPYDPPLTLGTEPSSRRLIGNLRVRSAAVHLVRFARNSSRPTGSFRSARFFLVFFLL